MSGNVYESIMHGLTEAVEYQQGRINARRMKLSITPVVAFKTEDIKRNNKYGGRPALKAEGLRG